MKNIFLLSVAAVAFTLTGCNSQNTSEINNDAILTNQTLTAEQRAKMTPDDVLANLKAGNADFMNNDLTVRNNTQRIRDAAVGQFPEAVILSCLDSRVPVEDVFHRGIGDLFVARVAGNISNPDILGSLEFATKVAGAKLVMVLGHDYCGAVEAAIDNVELGNITTLLAKIRPAVEKAKIGFKGEAKSSNPEFVDAVCRANVALVIEDIRANSPILKDLEAKGKIKIVGGIYDMHTGKVTLF